MQTQHSEYTHAIQFCDKLPDESSWEKRLLNLGLHREAFTIQPAGNDMALVKFWEPDRIEALRLLARLNA